MRTSTWVGVLPVLLVGVDVSRRTGESLGAGLVLAFRGGHTALGDGGGGVAMAIVMADGSCLVDRLPAVDCA